MFSVLLGSTTCKSTLGHYTKEVVVRLEKKGEQLELQAASLSLQLQRGDAELVAAVGEEVREEVLRVLGGSLFTGSVSDRPDCRAYVFLEDTRVMSGSVVCPEVVWVLEEGSEEGKVRLHRRAQGLEGRGVRARAQEERACRLFIHTDPFMWRHLAGRHREPRKAAVRMMVDHVLAANQLYGQTSFQRGEDSASLSVGFQLTGWRVDDDSKCRVADQVG